MTQYNQIAIALRLLFMKQEAAKTLYVVGNGFDQYHGLKTSYDDFRKFVKRTDSDLYELVEKYFMYKKKDFWHDFEENLGLLDDDLLRDYAINFLEQYGCKNWSDSFNHNYQYEISRIIETLTKGLHKSFELWLSKISLNDTKRKPIEFSKDAYYLSFNYTDTLEKVYGISIANILHIHGYYSKINKNRITYGHGGHNYKIDKSIEDPRVAEGEEIIKNYFKTSKKPVVKIIQKHKEFFCNTIHGTKKVVVIGHSMNSIDFPYFKEINKSLENDVNWIYYYHSTYDIVNCLKTLHSRLKIPLGQIHFLTYPI